MQPGFKTVTTVPKIHKIITFKKACSLIALFKKENKRVVYTSGSFDILHIGHIRYLRAAKREGDILVVGLESDKSITNTRGSGRPINKLAQRLEVIAALECVDYCFGFKDVIKSYESANETFYNRYKDLKANIVVMPPNTKTDMAQKNQVLQAGSEVVVVDLPVFTLP
jgi:rfaE bifunctional protein nucleotidyltransferase chain/domain